MNSQDARVLTSSQDFAEHPAPLFRGMDPARLDRYARTATDLLLQGKRPTADALVTVLGGSKTDAVRALSYFWQFVLPAKLDPDVLPKPPSAVEEALGNVWQLAVDTAAKTHQQSLDEMKARLEALEVERNQSVDLNADLIAERDDWKSRCQRAEDATRQAREDHALQDRVNQELRGQLADTQAKLQAATAESAELRVHVRGLEDELKDLPDLEGQLERALAARDQLKAALNQLERTRISDLDALRGAHQQEKEKLESQVATVRSDLAASRSELARALEDAQTHLAEAAAAREALHSAQMQVAILNTKLESSESALGAERTARSATEQLLGSTKAQLEAALAQKAAAEAALRDAHAADPKGDRSELSKGSGQASKKTR